MGAKLSKDDLILYILNHVPKTCETTAEICEDNLKKGTLTLETLRDRLRTKFSCHNMDDSTKVAAGSAVLKKC